MKHKQILCSFFFIELFMLCLCSDLLVDLFVAFEFVSNRDIAWWKKQATSTFIASPKGVSFIG